MPVQFDWIVEQRVVKITASQAYRRADLVQVNQVIMDTLLNNNNQKVYSVNDVSKLTTILFSPYDLTNNLKFARHDHFGEAYIIGTHNSLKAVANLMVTILWRAMGTKVQFVDSIEDALQQIQQLEPDLDFSQFQQP